MNIDENDIKNHKRLKISDEHGFDEKFLENANITIDQNYKS